MTAMRQLLEPDSVAVVGASASPDKSGHILLKNLLDHGFPGRLYPINPSADAILGLRTYASVAQLPEAVDLVFIVVPRAAVLEVVSQCAARKVKAVVIVSAGFGEVGGDGPKMEAELQSLLTRSGIRAIGPNTTGFVNTGRKLVASFVPFPRWTGGPVALAGQSGMFVGALADELMAGEVQGLGIRLAVGFGNKIDLDEVDFLDHAARDPEIRVIALHLESLKRPREFLDLVRQVSPEKPVIVLKTGRTPSGARAAASHTGALAVEDRILDGAFRQANAIRARGVEDFLALIRAFVKAPAPAGPRVGVLTYSGASGVIASDEIEEAGLLTPPLAKTTVARIATLMPDWQPVGNPADVWLAIGGGPRRALEESLTALLDDPGVDIVLGLLLGVPNADFPEVSEVFAGTRRSHPGKPLFLAITGGGVKGRWLRALEGLDIPVESDVRVSVQTIRAMVEYGGRRRRQAPDGSGAQ